MKQIVFIIFLVFCCSVSSWASKDKAAPVSFVQDDEPSLEKKIKAFRENIPLIAKQYIGMPYKYGGNPLDSGTSDNSHLFFSIFYQAAKKANLSYNRYMTMETLLQNIQKVDEQHLQNGDFIVLKNNHTAMIYHVEPDGKLIFIYASEKRQQILSFNNRNLVFQVYWLRNLKGYYRLNENFLHHDN